MPVGKSGKYYMNPHQMRRDGDEPGEAKSASGMHRPDDQEAGGEGAEGDGNHHHEIHEHEDGTAHSIHTHPDGHKEEVDHASYPEAVAHEHEVRGPGAEEEHSDHDADDAGGGSDGEDIAGMYAKDCE